MGRFLGNTPAFGGLRMTAGWNDSVMGQQYNGMTVQKRAIIKKSKMIETMSNPTEKTTRNEEDVQIVEYTHEHRARFKEINEQWITRLYIMEEEDIKTVEDPEGYVLKGGGKIFIALYKGFPVGTCAYLNMGSDVYEMIKMAVDENYRGLRIGNRIGEESMQAIKDLGAKKIILFSNTEGSAAAIKLYHKLGFTEVPLGTSEFIRANIKMEMVF
jgi:ribosomal protein S18 acetylase RimI-like enzyme